MVGEGVRPDARTYTILLRACVAGGEQLKAASLLRAAAGLRCTAPPVIVGLQDKVGCNCLQPRGPPVASEVVKEVFDDLAGKCGDAGMAVQLMQDLQKARSHCVSLDPKIRA